MSKGSRDVRRVCSLQKKKKTPLTLDTLVVHTTLGWHRFLDSIIWSDPEYFAVGLKFRKGGQFATHRITAHAGPILVSWRARERVSNTDGRWLT